MSTRNKKFSPKKKGFRDGLSYSIPQKSEKTRGNAVTYSQSHPIKKCRILGWDTDRSRYRNAWEKNRWKWTEETHQLLYSIDPGASVQSTKVPREPILITEKWMRKIFLRYAPLCCCLLQPAPPTSNIFRCLCIMILYWLPWHHHYLCRVADTRTTMHKTYINKKQKILSEKKKKNLGMAYHTPPLKKWKNKGKCGCPVSVPSY